MSKTALWASANDPAAARPINRIAPPLSLDAIQFLADSYGKLVEDLIDPRANITRLEFAYARLLGTRGSLCRLCSVADMTLLPARVRNRWRWAETHLRDSLTCRRRVAEVNDVAQRVEAGWAESVERYALLLPYKLAETEIPDKLGILKGVDTVGMHLAQREIFALSRTFDIPIDNAPAVKLRVRLLSLFLTLHRCGFGTAYPAIQSYRETFRIDDPVAYPWWFVDRHLTERHLNWTYRRLPAGELDWRF